LDTTECGVELGLEVGERAVGCFNGSLQTQPD
jgi:hypothetical protein